MFLPLKLIKKRVKFTYTYIELKIICKSKIVSLQLSLKKILYLSCILMSSGKMFQILGATVLKALSPSVFFDRAL